MTSRILLALLICGHRNTRRLQLSCSLPILTDLHAASRLELLLQRTRDRAEWMASTLIVWPARPAVVESCGQPSRLDAIECFARDVRRFVDELRNLCLALLCTRASERHVVGNLD